MGTNLIGIGNYIRNNKVMGEGGKDSSHPNLVEFWDFRGRNNNDANVNKVVGQKGHILTLHNFSFEGESGYGLYTNTISSWNRTSIFNITKTKTSVTAANISSQGFIIGMLPEVVNDQHVTKDIKSFKFKVKGLLPGSILQTWVWKGSVRNYKNYKTDGIYEFPYSEQHVFQEGDDLTTSAGIFIKPIEQQVNFPITITLLPEQYEDALVLDGIDDYASYQSFPQLKDYTVIVKRENIESINNTALVSRNFGQYGAFVLEHIDTEAKYKEYSFGVSTEVNKFTDDKITWQTATSYNGKNIAKGTVYDSTLFLLGRLFQSTSYPTAKAAVYYVAIYDRSLTQQEINDEIRKHEGSKSWRDDMVLHWDFSSKTNDSSDLTTIEDLSGNGHHGTLHNFTFEGTSGYGYYPVVFGEGKTWNNIRRNEEHYESTHYNTKINITKLTTSGLSINWTHVKLEDKIVNVKEFPPFRIKVTGINEWCALRYLYLEENAERVTVLPITKDGIYDIPMSHKVTENLVAATAYCGFSSIIDMDNIPDKCNIVIEIIPDPQYNNYLVFDGIDDYCFVDNLDPLTDYTVIIDRKWISYNTSRNSCLLSKRISATNHGAFSVESRSISGTPICKSFSGPSETISIQDDIVYVTRNNYDGRYNLIYGNLPDSTHMCLGSNYTTSASQFAQVAVRKVVLFNRTLSEEEIQEVKSELFDENLIINSFIEKSKQEYQVASYDYKRKLEAGKYYKLTFCYTKPNNVSYLQIFQDNGFTPISGQYASTVPYTIQSVTFLCKKSTSPSANDSMITFYQYPNGEIGSTIHWCVLTEAHAEDSLIEGWDFSKNSNDSETNNILTGIKGNQLKLYNFNYEGMSGWNGYPVTFGIRKTWESFRLNSDYFTATYKYNIINITKITTLNTAIQYTYTKKNGVITDYNGEVPAFKIKVQGLVNCYNLYYHYYPNEGATKAYQLAMTEDGTYSLPKSHLTDKMEGNNTWIGFTIGPRSGGVIPETCNIIIEILPNYNECIITDGVDDYMCCDTLPKLFPTYTFLYKRKWLSKDPGKFHYFISKSDRGANYPIGIEHYIANPGIAPYEAMSNFGMYNKIPISLNDVNSMSDLYYNNFKLNKGTLQDKGTQLYIAGLQGVACVNSAIYWIYVYNRSLTKDEIKKEITKIENKYYE